MFRVALCCMLTVFGLASALRASERGGGSRPARERVKVPEVIAETTQDGLTLAIIEHEPVYYGQSLEKADGHLCAQFRITPISERIEAIEAYSWPHTVLVAAVTDQDETLRPPPHFVPRYRHSSPISRSYAMTFLASAKPAETLYLSVTLPQVSLVSEWRTVSIDLAEGGKPPATLPDIPGLKSVTSNPLGYTVAFSPDWLPDTEGPDNPWLGRIRMDYVLEDGTVQQGSGGLSWSYRTVDGDRIIDGVEYALQIGRHHMPVRLILRVPTKGERRDVVAEFKDIPIRALLCGTADENDEDESEQQGAESE